MPEAGFAVTLLPGRGIQRAADACDNVGAVVGPGPWRRAQAVALVAGAQRPRSWWRSAATPACRAPLAAVGCCGFPSWWPSRTRCPARPTGSSAASPGPARSPSPARRCRERSSPATRCGPRSWPSTARRDRAAARRRARPARGPARRRRLRRVARGPPRINEAVLGARRALGRPRRPRRAPRGRRARTGSWSPATSAGRVPRDGAASTSRCATRTAWTAVAGRRRPGRLPGGGNTVAELAAVGLPSVLVPLPGAPGDHQTANARPGRRGGAAVLVPDAELDGDRLVGRGRRGSWRDRAGWRAWPAAARSLARPRRRPTRSPRLVEEHAR